MAIATERRAEPEIGRSTDNWVIGGIIGFIAGGVCAGIVAPSPIMANLAAMFTLEGVAAAWAVHFLVSILFGVIFAGLVTISPLPGYASRVTTGAGLGMAYGFVIWIGGVVFIMPWWLGLVTPANPPIPDLNWVVLAGLLAYGVILGTLYPVLLANN